MNYWPNNIFVAVHGGISPTAPLATPLLRMHSFHRINIKLAVYSNFLLFIFYILITETRFWLLYFCVEKNRGPHWQGVPGNKLTIVTFALL